ncbi:MAG: type II secretion system protein [Phycisphaerae bacterium]|nr:type II secretion system protein [Phycisphaerae bacterium]
MKTSGLTLTELLVAITIIALCVLILIPILARIRYNKYRTACADNLSAISKAIWYYANDYNDEFPVAGGPDSKWGRTPNWQAADLSDAYGRANDADGCASISANFYLLIKYEQLKPRSFICPVDPNTAEFTLAKHTVRGKKLIDLWDFGPDPSKHVSYSYHSSYGPYALTSSNLPGMAVAADRNPWLAAPGHPARPTTDFQAFDPNGTRESIKRANAVQHQEDGQNVLYVDGHASFEKQSFCGVKDDNIYTRQNAADVKKGTLPTLTSQPASRKDSLLLNDPPTGTAK